MIEMPPLQFAQTNGIRMGYYEAGPNTDKPPVILCHGWPEMAFSWRHQIKALSEAGIRVIAPDQRGYGATDRPEPVEAYDMEHLTGDLVGLMDHLKIDKAIFVGHDWGGFIVWQMPLRHPARVAGVVGVNTPHWDRAPVDPIELFRKRYGDRCISSSFRIPRASRTRFLAAASSRRLIPSCASLCRARTDAPARRRQRASAPRPSSIWQFRRWSRPTIRNTTHASRSCRRRRRRCSSTPSPKPASPAASTGTAISPATGNVPQASTIQVRVPSLMIMAENDAVLPPSAADGMEKIVPDLEKYLVRDSGHWTQQEKPDEVSAKLIEWRRKRFG